MLSQTVKISAQGQLTLPRAMRDVLGISPGSEVKLNLDSKNSSLIIERAKTLEEQLAEFRQDFTPKMKRAIRKDRGKTANQLMTEYFSSKDGQKELQRINYGE
jgi:AbrB family looped-hinge helix DNA binding protein